MRILRAGDYREMPWKNGGGTTTEIAVSPANAGIDAFDWRISMARVEGGGPFSLFPGIDRTLSILEGEGIVLDIDGRAPVRLTRGSEPLSFPADAATSATLIGGTVIDLNVMTRRGRASHYVQRIAVSGTVEIEAGADADAVAVFCAAGHVSVQGVTAAGLGPRDTLFFGSQSRPLRLESHGQASLFVIRITIGDHAV